MLLVLFLLLAPLYRILLYLYRFLRIKRLKSIYDKWITTGLIDRNGKTISIFEYSGEINSLIQKSGNNNFFFSAQKTSCCIKSDASALQKAIGTFKHEIKRSFFPHTYLLMLINLPRSLSEMLKITRGKALLLILYVIYTLLGILDVSLLVDKIVNILG